MLMTEPKKQNPSMEDINKAKLTLDQNIKEDGKIRIMVQVAVPRNQLGFAFDSNENFNIAGLEVDRSYSPVPVKSPTDVEASLAFEEKEIVVIRGTVDKAKIEELKKQPGVIRVDDDPKIAPFSTLPEPIDCTQCVPRGTLSDVVTYLEVDKIWSSGHTGKDIVVGIIDCGITAEGRPVKPGETSNRISNVIGGWPSQDWGTTSKLWDEHGNMCATDVLGIAPDVKLYDIRVADSNTIEGLLSDALKGFRWAINQYKIDKTPHIISNSWGIWQENWAPIYARDPNHSFTLAVVEAIEAGIIVLFAAGNCGSGCPHSKCGFDFGAGKGIWGANGHPQVMTVGAVNRDEQYIGYSSQGPAALSQNKPDFCSISHFEGYFISDNGTSAACPIAAGVVALLKEAKPSLMQDEAKKLLKDTAKDIGPIGEDEYTGSGIIRPKAAHNRIV